MTEFAGFESEPEEQEPSEPLWHKAPSITLNVSATSDEALALIIRTSVAHLRANEECVLARSHEEGIHQMRVAVRRARSCLSLFKGMIPEEQVTHLSGELRWLIGELGPARDWDVFVNETLKAMIKALPDESGLQGIKKHAEQERGVSYDRVAEAIGSQRYIGLVMLLDAWAEGRRWQTPGSSVHPQAALARDFATMLLDKRLSRIVLAGDQLRTLSGHQRHAVRIQVKKLRYATDFFGTLYPRRRVTGYLTLLKALQDQLGMANDVEVAGHLLSQLTKGSHGKERAELNFAAGLVIGWYSHLAREWEERLITTWERFAARAPFWIDENLVGTHEFATKSHSSGGRKKTGAAVEVSQASIGETTAEEIPVEAAVVVEPALK